MKNGEFQELAINQTIDISGGAIVGAAVGYIGGLFVGTRTFGSV